MPAYGQNVNVWPEGAFGHQGTTPNDTPTLKVFQAPKDAPGPVPAVLLIPGGGYKHISGYQTFSGFFLPSSASQIPVATI